MRFKEKGEVVVDWAVDAVLLKLPVQTVGEHLGTGDRCLSWCHHCGLVHPTCLQLTFAPPSVAHALNLIPRRVCDVWQNFFVD